MRDFKIYFSIATALLLVYLIAQFNKPTPLNWSPTFYYNDKIPFGTYVTYHRLNDLFPASTIIKTNNSIYRAMHDSIATPGTYLVIAKTVKINKNDFDELVKYIKKGNSVFLSAFNFTGFLADTLHVDINTEIGKADARLNFTNPRLKQHANYSFSRDISNQYFDNFDTAKAIVLGENSLSHATYLSYKFGAGNLYLSANPAVFTNFSILTDAGADYVSKALSYLPVTKNIYWDEFQNGDIPEDQSPMRVFFSKPNLQWAYYLSLFSIVIFVLFEMKRRQRIIPVIEPLTNSTLEFVTVVGQVYYEKRNNANIAQKKVLYLLTFLRDEYHIKTNKLDDEFVEKLTAKLGIEQSLVTDLINYIKYLDVQHNVTDRDLIELNKLIEKFYIKST